MDSAVADQSERRHLARMGIYPGSAAGASLSGIHLIAQFNLRILNGDGDEEERRTINRGLKTMEVL